MIVLRSEAAQPERCVERRPKVSGRLHFCPGKGGAHGNAGTLNPRRLLSVIDLVFNPQHLVAKPILDAERNDS